ncbi:iron ABC transporter ATP-binding protein [Lachnoclostridium sp. An131]|jgi:iron complex transport system ATP-binding protein|uniref:ABC transporter ATP-binding protein n=1 Tax=Lachnoclostridium sp. An131 TaxID=1965555 RepID=UPI000B38E79B|nr:ABC transporter ATP-binding protein [Lachnoclostridium sp. An131]OUQ23929.1 iron ABC transporter ATP-binding protein [Lachnoclostridium sp. An131]
MLSVENLQFHYQGGPKVLKKINFSLGDGEFLAILGNNGAGKSTMLKCFNHIITPDAGEVLLNGENLLKMSAKEVARRIAFVAQNVPDTQMTVHDMVMLGRRPYMSWAFTERDHEIVHEAMDRLKVSEFRGRFLNRLSGGERQKVMLARALAQEPKLLLLDEPTSSLDLKNQYQVLQIVKDICHETGISAIVVIHDLNLALRFCDRFLLMQQGEVYRYGDAGILDREAIWEVYGVHGEVVSAGNQKVVIVDE